MKKLVLALAAVAAFAAPALAADMAPRYAKAPAVAPVAVANWTGCYIGGGGGYGLWNQENTLYDDTTAPRTRVTNTQTGGGRGYFGTVGGGCDYQFPVGTWNFVVGAFGDYDFAAIKGDPNFTLGTYGREKLDSQWSVGGRVGLLVTPQLLTYFSAGYTEAHFNQVNLLSAFAPGGPAGFYFGARNYSGYFLGAGDEYALSFLPGLFWKTEYRFSDLDTQTNPLRFTAGNALTGASIDSHKYVHTVRSELVYRFNWGSPVVAKY
ncbi:MAG: porin family protein [Rhizobiales bacterium]|nr:porin family protein [Hyphomicrobiales bacterium]